MGCTALTPATVRDTEIMKAENDSCDRRRPAFVFGMRWMTCNDLFLARCNPLGRMGNREEDAMADFRIPAQLLEMVVQHRVIPFIGAGFSAPLNMPGWNQLLSAVADELALEIPFEALRTQCRDDPLQIAEYLFLKADGRIGPIRHAIEGRLKSPDSPVISTAHVELVNLGMPQVYTTNFDELIERTYRELEEPASLIVLPKDVATIDSTKVQIVKYHGDLRHESTLVLTESSYYTRLDFQTPMDLKFRSDLLGKSVLFIGYSFQDINIRVIWFQLMRMMREIPARDRPLSYIVRIHPNEVLDTLYEAVGLHPIILDPSESATEPEQWNALLADFMLELSLQANLAERPQDRITYLSSGLANAIIAEADSSPSRRRIRYVSQPGPRYFELVTYLGSATVPQALVGLIDPLLTAIAKSNWFPPKVIPFAVNAAKDWGSNVGVTRFFSRAITREISRNVILSRGDVPWGDIWGESLTHQDFLISVRTLESELELHEDSENPLDFDIAFALDVVSRFLDGEIYQPGTDDEELRAEAEELRNRVAKLYPSSSRYEAPPGGSPEPYEILQEIQSRMEQTQRISEDPDELS